MIGTLVDLLGNFYVDNDLTHFETIARTLHASVPEDLVSLQFLGLAFYRTGRIDEAVSIFDKVVRRRKGLVPDSIVDAAPVITGDDKGRDRRHAADHQGDQENELAWMDRAHARPPRYPGRCLEHGRGHAERGI